MRVGLFCSHGFLHGIRETKFLSLFLCTLRYHHKLPRKHHEKEFFKRGNNSCSHSLFQDCKKCCILIVCIIICVIATYCCMFHILNLCTSSCNIRDLLSLNFHKPIFIVMGAIKTNFHVSCNVCECAHKCLCACVSSLENVLH